MTGGCVEQYVACIVYGRWWGKCGIDINLKWINFPAARRKEILQDNLIKKNIRDKADKYWSITLIGSKLFLPATA